MAVCLTHQERPATHRCRTCARPLCGQCALEFEEGTYCSPECRDRARAAEARIADHRARDRAAHAREAQSRALRWLLLGLLALGLLMAWPYLPDSLIEPLRRLAQAFRR